MNYTKELMKRFKNPKNVKDVKDASATGEVGNIKCGDIMKLQIKVVDGKIKDVGFKTFGCPAAVASSDVVCDLAKGKTIEEAKKLSKDDIVNALGGMPPIKVHCSLLGIDALRKAIEEYELNN